MALNHIRVICLFFSLEINESFISRRFNRPINRADSVSNKTIQLSQLQSSDDEPYSITNIT